MSSAIQDGNSTPGLLDSLFRARPKSDSPETPSMVTLPDDARSISLYTLAGKQLSGSLAATDDGRLGFFTSDFQEVLPLDTAIIASIRFQATVAPENELKDKYHFWLRDGDVLQGSLTGLTADGVYSIDADGIGEVAVAAADLDRMDVLASDVLAYLGPTGLSDWEQSGTCLATGPNGFWPQAAKPRSWIAKDFGLDKNRIVDLELTRKRGARFRLYLLGKSLKRSDKSAIVIEIWGDMLVAINEGKDKHEAVLLPGAIRMDESIVLHFVTTEDSITFFGEDGEEIVSFPRPEGSGPALRLECDQGSVAVRKVKVIDADSEIVPKRFQASELQGYDAQAKTFQTAEGDIASSLMLGVDFDNEFTEPEQKLRVRLVYLGGRRITGEFLRLDEESVTIQPDWQADPITCSLEGMEAITVTGHKKSGGSIATKSFLVTGNGEISGELDSIGSDGGIRWKPSISDVTVNLQLDSVKRIVINRQTAFFVSSRSYPHYLRLRSGDSFRCEVIAIGQETSTFKTPFGQEVELDNSTIKAIEFDTRTMAEFAKLFEEKEEDANTMRGWGGGGQEVRRETSAGFDAASLERALALPRKYKKRGFEHLVLARNGDFLRTDVVAWAPEGILYSSGLTDERLIPTNRLAAVVWLDETVDIAGADDLDLNHYESKGARLILDDQNFFAVTLQGTENGFLTARSPVLGDLRIDLSHILSIELAGRLTAPPSIYSEWVLKPKQEPFPDGDGAAAGLPEVGKQAPQAIGTDFNGEAFDLDTFRGKVVVLDFWGFW